MAWQPQRLAQCSGASGMAAVTALDPLSRGRVLEGITLQQLDPLPCLSLLQGESMGRSTQGWSEEVGTSERYGCSQVLCFQGY